MTHAVREHRSGDFEQLQPRWSYMMFVGMLLMIGGLYAASYAFTTSMIAAMVLGLFLCFSGIFHIINAIFAHGTKKFFFTLFAGVLGLVIGGWILFEPVASVMALTWLFALYFALSGLFRMITAIVYRKEFNWFWVFLSGFFSLVLAMIIYAHWPISGVWVIGLFIGIDLFLSGLSMVILALAARRA